MSTPELFRSRLEEMIDLHHPLAKLADHLSWNQIESAVAPSFSHKPLVGKAKINDGLFGPTLELSGGGISDVALVACMRKFLIILHARVKTNKPWDAVFH